MWQTEIGRRTSSARTLCWLESTNKIKVYSNVVAFDRHFWFSVRTLTFQCNTQISMQTYNLVFSWIDDPGFEFQEQSDPFELNWIILRKRETNRICSGIHYIELDHIFDFLYTAYIEATKNTDWSVHLYTIPGFELSGTGQHREAILEPESVAVRWLRRPISILWSCGAQICSALDV